MADMIVRTIVRVITGDLVRAAWRYLKRRGV